jgi:hypothetical protein
VYRISFTGWKEKAYFSGANYVIEQTAVFKFAPGVSLPGAPILPIYFVEIELYIELMPGGKATVAHTYECNAFEVLPDLCG